MGTSKFNAVGNPAMVSHPIQGGVEILLAASWTETGDERQSDGSLGLNAGFTSRYLYHYATQSH